MNQSLSSIPAKRYFTIGEVSSLCGVKPHVLRYWEQEFTQLRPMKRRGNRRYYQLHEVLMIRTIRELLYDRGFTIVGARHQLQKVDQSVTAPRPAKQEAAFESDEPQQSVGTQVSGELKNDSVRLDSVSLTPANWSTANAYELAQQLRSELQEIRHLLE